MGRTEASRIDPRKCASSPVYELYAALDTDRNGLSSEKASALMQSHGANVLPEQARPLLIIKFLGHLKNLFNVLLLVAAGLCFFVGVSSDDPTSYQMGFAIVAVVIVSILFTLFQEKRAESAVDAIKDLVPKNAKVMRDGKIKQLAISEIVPGDVIFLEEGDKVPADARVVESFSLSVDNIILTGESDLQRRSAMCGAEAVAEDLYKCKNLLFAGTTISSGNAYAVVVATGPDTEFGRIVAMAQNVVESESPLQKQLDGTARLNFIVAIAVGIAFFVTSILFLRLSFLTSILFMIGVMICLVPEGLQITVTLSLALSSQAMSKRNVIVKRLSSVETLGSCTVICSDKTGTITEGQMTVRMAWAGGETFEVSGEGYGPEGSITSGGETLKAQDRTALKVLCDIAALDNTATLVPPLDRRKSRWTAVGDTTDAALLVFAIKGGLIPKASLVEQPRIGMIPFDSNRKMMSSVHRAGPEILCYTKGAGQAILPRCSSILWAGKIVPLTRELKAQVIAQMEAFAKGAYRVLALAYRTMPGESTNYESDTHETDLTFAGLVAIYDPPRAEVPEAIHKARTAGIRIIMITGDHELTAEAIARKVGIISGSDFRVVTGTKLAQMSDKHLVSLLKVKELVFARTTPEQKLRIVRMLRARREIVAVTGDGVNDAPALLEADIGVAMGITGTDVARESADMVLLDDNFASIVNGIEEGRAVFDNLKKFIIYVFCHNWAEMVAFLAFVLLGCPLPLAVIQVLLIDLFLEIPTGLSLTSEAPEPGIMERAPRKKGTKLFGKWAMARAAYIGLAIGVYTLMWVFYYWNQSGWSGESVIENADIYLKGMTIMTAGIVAGQLGVLFAMRTGIKSSFEVALHKNKWLAYTAVIEFLGLLVAINLPVVNELLMLSPIDPVYWLALYLIAPVVLLMEEARKAVVRSTLKAPALVPVVHPLPEPARADTGQPSAANFVERTGPVVVITGMAPDDEDAFVMALTMGEHSGSRVILARTQPVGKGQWMEKRFGILAERAVKIPFEYAETGLEKSGRRTVPGEGFRKMIEASGTETVIVTVGRDAFKKSGHISKNYSWLREYSEKRIILVSPGPTKRQYPDSKGYRILIPVLEAFHKMPFELASALSGNRNIPDVDVIAAKVVEMPAITPLYSIYRPETLVDSKRQLSFLQNMKGWPILKFIHSKVLLVRNTVRDLVDFASERKVDMVILEGDWAHERTGFTSRVERDIAINAKCTVAVVLPPDSAV